VRTRSVTFFEVVEESAIAYLIAYGATLGIAVITPLADFVAVKSKNLDNIEVFPTIFA
jgi:hypothetical protein